MVDRINFNVTWKIIERTFNTLGSIKCVLLQLKNGLIILFGCEAGSMDIQVRSYLGTVFSKNLDGINIILFLVYQFKRQDQIKL